MNKSIYIENYGCTSNKFDLGILLASLDDVGFLITEDIESADILLVNTCGVKQPTEDKILHKLSLLSDIDKPVIITGCLSEINLKAIKTVIPNYSAILNPHSIDRLSAVLKELQNGQSNILCLSDTSTNKLKLPRKRVHKCIEIIQISEGCLGSCSFCCTRFARGQLFSYPLNSIIGSVKKAVNKGMREIWLTGQDTGAYGIDIGFTLDQLLVNICRIEGDYLLRIGMMNPTHVLTILDPLVRVFKNEKIFKFLHLPLQSGNDNILKHMCRSYTVNDFVSIVNAFRKQIPEITLATDIICGFPGESEKAFSESLQIIAEIKPDIVNISKFSPRPKTPATKLKQLSSQIVKERSRQMSSLCREISFELNKRWLGWIGDVLINEKGKDNTWIGRNFAYKPIVIRENKAILGECIRIRLTQAFPTYLMGERVDS